MNVGIYCRLSNEDKNKLKSDDSQSIQNQKAMLKDYCHERNWEIYDIYCDDGYSGTDRNRPEFKRLLDDCENGKINIVLCKDQSRFSRDIIIVEQYINGKFHEWGVRFIGVADNTDSESELYSAISLFTSAYNEMYVKDISSKIRRTLAHKREQGQFIGSFAPYGYKVSPENRHTLIIDHQTAPIVQKIFHMYSQGFGYRKIVDELNKNGIPNPSAYKKKSGSNYINCNAGSGTSNGMWTQSTISAILKNETYIGTLVQGKSHNISYKNRKRKKVPQDKWVKIPNSHKALIDHETWENVQNRLNSHTRSSRKSKELPALSGKVRCAVCGRPMKRNVYYNKAKTIQYYSLQCADCKTGTMQCTNKRSISGKLLEQNIINELNGIIEKYFQPVSPTSQTEKLRNHLSELQEKLKNLRKHLTTMYHDRLENVISQEEYSLFRKNISAEETETKQQISEINTKINEYSHSPELPQYPQISALSRRIADEFIDFIEVGQVTDSKREIHIHWKI